ncbi:MAG: hypothetical protein ACLP6G_02025 [Terriglobales bacterium]
MFEAEVEMEQRSSFLPLLLLLSLVAAIVGIATYVVIQVRSKTPLTAQEANGIVAAELQGPGPAIIHFRTGLVISSVDEKPGDPHYRLLEKAGVLRLAKTNGRAVMVSLTSGEERQMEALPGFKKWKEADGTFTYQVPLAQRQLVSISSVTMNGVNNAIVEYTWKWVPNQFGEMFDAGGPLVKGFNLWDRKTLIDKYEADFYHGNPAKSTLALARADQGWKISVQ